MSGYDETDHAGICAPNQSDGDAVEDDVLLATQEIDTRMEAVAHEKKTVVGSDQTPKEVAVSGTVGVRESAAPGRIV